MRKKGEATSSSTPATSERKCWDLTNQKADGNIGFTFRPAGWVEGMGSVLTPQLMALRRLLWRAVALVGGLDLRGDSKS